MGTAVRQPEAPGAPPAPAPPRLAPGLELLGRYEDSGFKDPPYLARRADGQVVQLSQLLHLVAEAVDGTRDEAQIAAAVSERVGRTLTADDARFLIERKLRPQGVLAGADGKAPALEKRQAALALRHRRAFVPAPRVQTLARLFQPLFHAPVVLAALAALLALDAWLFFDHGVAGPLRAAIYEPMLLLGVFAAMIAGTAFHEVGHAAACRFSGARPGAIGAGMYLIWPAFYCDVTDAYRLPRRGRLRTDLGGVYFNAVFSLAAAGAYFATGQEALLLVIVAQHFVVAQQLLPLLRFDGYYVLTDLTGVPDILSRVKPILRSALPWREREPAAGELKPWVRRVTTLYLAAVVPLVAALVGWVVLGAPRLLATVLDSLVRHGESASAAARGGDWAPAALAALESAALLLPALAMAMTVHRLAKLAFVLARRWSRGNRRRQAVALVSAAAAAALVAASLWPDGDYRPLQPDERWTIAQVYSTPLQAADRSSGYAPAERRAAAPGARAPGEPGAPRLRERLAAEQDERRAPGPAASEPEPAGEPAQQPGAAAASATPAPAGAAQPPAADPSATATPIPQPGGGDPVNEARAVNTIDGARLFELAFDIQRVRGGDAVDFRNVAQAIASCNACRTVAIAVQVVIVMGGSQLAAPVNVAESINSVCTACGTLALAWQLVVTTSGEVELTQDALRRIQAIEEELAALEASDAPVADVQAAAERLLADLRETVLTGLVPTGGAGDTEPAQQEAGATSQSDPAPTPTATPTAEPSEPEEEPAAEQTPQPEDAGEPEPTPTPTAEPGPSATAEPSPEAEPTPP